MLKRSLQFWMVLAVAGIALLAGAAYWWDRISSVPGPKPSSGISAYSEADIGPHAAS